MDTEQRKWSAIRYVGMGVCVESNKGASCDETHSHTQALTHSHTHTQRSRDTAAHSPFRFAVWSQLRALSAETCISIGYGIGIGIGIGIGYIVYKLL